MRSPDPFAQASATRNALVAGATGLVGREILRGLAADDSVARIHALVRRPLGFDHPKVSEHVVDFTALPALPPVEEVYLALGTTIKVAGSQAAFRAVDFDANLAVAKAAKAAGARRAGLVSAMGSDAGSSVFYSRVKGELEQALAGLGYEGIVIARPSMLAGDRESLGQPARGGEVLALKISRSLRMLIPANYRSIQAEHVAKALLDNVPRATGTKVLLSGAMQP